MCSIQKIRKSAFILLLATLITLIPSNTFSVFADDIVPPFPYDELQTIGENDYALFRVHGVDQVDYIECIAPKIQAPGNYGHLLPGLSYSSLGGWVLQLNSIDYCFKNGEKVNFDLQSLATTSFVAVDNDDPYFSFWLEFVYSTEDVWGINEDSEFGYGIKFFKAQNFIIPPAATPTPTPAPDDEEPELDTKFPTFVNAYYNNTLNNQNRAVTKYLVSNRYYDESNTRYEYQNIFVCERFNPYLFGTTALYTPTYNGYDYSNNTLTFYFPNIAERNWTGIYSVTSFVSDNYYTIDDIFDINDYAGVYPASQMTETTERNYQFTVNTSSMNYEATAIYSINSDGTCSRLDGQGGGTATPTPTPTSAPTPIPQPSEIPETDDSNDGSGWGIVNALKYIFVPDGSKLTRIQKTCANKFHSYSGGYDDLRHVSGFEDPPRPENVEMSWRAVGHEPGDEQTYITIVNFETIDHYLFETESGQFICDCLEASFTFLMFGYLIHVIRKHLVIENTDDNEKGGGD